VKVRDDHPLHETGEIDLNNWAAKLAVKAELSDDERLELLHACEFCYQAEEQARSEDNVWVLGASSLRTGLEMANILAELHVDASGLVAAVLYRVVREGQVPLIVIKKTFGKTVAKLIDNVQRMAIIDTLRNDTKQEVFGFAAGQQAAMLREMLVSVIDDVRVALIKLAERTCAIRAVKNASEEKRHRVAREIFDIYAPLAHRLGIGHIKWELEDLAFRYLEPDEYKKIATLLDEKRIDRQNFIDEVLDILSSALKESDIEGEIYGRAKHIYSIYRKMHRKQIDFSEVYDIRAMRILVPTVADCYAVLGIAHSKWRNIAHEFDDYIAAPKENGYKSLHTAVYGPHNKVLEIQIRTQQMHNEAELGVCSHWRYKGNDTKASAESYEEKIAWLRQILEWHEGLEPEESANTLSGIIAPERIYVFTPGGHVVDLPAGSSPLDFAYRVHTQIGHRCRGAKVNGRIVALNIKLKTSDQVEIITAKEESPSRDWLLSSLGYLRTSRARAKVQYWFRKQNQDKNIEAGRSIVQRELRQLGLKDIKFGPIAERFNKQGENGVYEAIGAGDVGIAQILSVANAQKVQNKPEFKILKHPQNASQFENSDIYIYGVGNLMWSIANCCKPVPGEAIRGYIRLGKGVSIHRKDCTNILRLGYDEPERIITVGWGGAPKNVYPVKLCIHSFDRAGLVKDVSSVLDQECNNIVEMNTRAGVCQGDAAYLMTMVIEVQSIEQLSGLIARLRQVHNVVDVRRIFD
jgi:GTP pyrophosphokinase